MLGQPFPIFSSEAVAYLRHAAHTLPSGTGTRAYATYHAAWMTEYEKQRVHFEAAATKHLSSTLGLVAGADAAADTAAWLGVGWFAMRGFDAPRSWRTNALVTWSVMHSS